MEYDFTYDRATRQFSLKLSAEHDVLARFLLDEFGQQASAYQPLLSQLQALKAYNTLRYQGKEYLLEVEHAEVTLRHNTLFYEAGDTPQQTSAELDEEALSLDDHGMQTQCGLEDLVKLLQAWQQFLSGG